MTKWIFPLERKVKAVIEGRDPQETYIIEDRQLKEHGVQEYTIASTATGEFFDVPDKHIRKHKIKYNTETQYYKEIPLKLIERGGYEGQKAKRFTLNGTNQNVWIPNKHLEEDGTIIDDENLDYVFRKSQRQLELAGLTGPIIGIKRRSQT